MEYLNTYFLNVLYIIFNIGNNQIPKQIIQTIGLTWESSLSAPDTDVNTAPPKESVIHYTFKEHLKNIFQYSRQIIKTYYSKGLSNDNFTMINIDVY